jgi:hypothetical protein
MSWHLVKNQKHVVDQLPMNTQYRKALPGTSLDYFDAREAVNAIQSGTSSRTRPRACRKHRAQGRSGHH